VFEDLLVLNYFPTESAILFTGNTEYGACCTTTFNRIVAGGNYSSGPIVKFNTTNSSGQTAVEFTNSSLTHPAAGQPIISCNNSTIPATAYAILDFDNIYMEGNNTDTTTPFIVSNSCQSLKFSGLSIFSLAGGSTAPAIQLNGTYDTSLDLSGLSMFEGFASYPAIAVQSNITGFNCASTPCNVMTDGNGNRAHYTNGTFQGDVINASIGFDVGEAPLNFSNLAGAATVSQLPSTAALTNSANNYTVAQAAPAFWPQSVAAGPYAIWFDDFFSTANNSLNQIGGSGATCSANNTYADANHPGNILLNSNTASGDGVTCGLQSASGAVVGASTSAGWTWETAVYVPVLPGTTAGTYQAGLAGAPNASPWTTGIGFYLSSANGVANDWYCRYGSTSSDTTVAATVAWARLAMVNDGANIHWYLNGTQVCGTGVAIGSMPSNTMYAASWSAVTLTASTAVTMAVDYVDFQRRVTR
jgi:hypothetical protein